MSESNLISDWKEHLGLFLGALSTLFVAIRILSIANFDPETAYGILQAGGAAAVIIGALLSFVGQVVFMVALFSAMITIAPLSEKEKEFRIPLMFVSVLSGLIAIATAPFVVFCFLAALLVITETTHKFRMRKLERRMSEVVRTNDLDKMMNVNRDLTDRIVASKRRQRTWFLGTILSCAVLLASYSLITPPWYPAERIDIKGSRPLAVYILSDSNNQIAALDIYTLQLKYFDLRLVTSRELCNDSGSLTAFGPLPTFFKSFQPHYAQCPKG